MFEIGQSLTNSIIMPYITKTKLQFALPSTIHWPHPQNECHSTYLTKHIAVKDLKNFIEAKLAQPLHGITNESRGPTLGKSSQSIFFYCDFETFNNVAILCWVHLKRFNIVIFQFYSMFKMLILLNSRYTCSFKTITHC